MEREERGAGRRRKGANEEVKCAEDTRRKREEKSRTDRKGKALDKERRRKRVGG